MAGEALTLVGLEERVEHRPNELSGGRQRVATARALVSNPVMPPADEPTGNLDLRAGMEIMQMFQALNRLRQGPNMLVTHDPRITAYCQRRLSLRDGKIVSDGMG